MACAPSEDSDQPEHLPTHIYNSHGLCCPLSKSQDIFKIIQLNNKDVQTDMALHGSCLLKKKKIEPPHVIASANSKVQASLHVCLYGDQT